MNPTTLSTLTDITLQLGKARSLARAQLLAISPSDLYQRANRQKYLAISAYIGDVQKIVCDFMQNAR